MITYNKTWEVMNDLEESFNRIITLDGMIDDLNDAVNCGDQDAIVDLSAAMTAFMPVYIRQYEKASQRAWNNTVTEVSKFDNPYRTKMNDVTYDDVVTYLKTDPFGNYVSTPEQETEDTGNGINEESS
tara:strand:+ start:4063 stop:4446 length:384 start_codon:yes stop_codon:yes gene_type:complete